MFDNNLSIILLTHDFINHTKKFILELYLHTPISFELVIVDNNSQDGTVEFLNTLKKKKSGIVVYNNKANKGVIEGRNQGYKLSTNSNEFICFLDNDQYLKKGWIESYEECFEKGNDLVGIEAWKVRGDFFPLNKVSDPHASFHYIGCGGMVIKRKVVEDIGLFDKQFGKMYFEDPDLCWRAYDAGYQIGWNSEKVINHEPHNLLGKSPERKKWFYDSLSKFQKKWKNRSLISLKNIVK